MADLFIEFATSPTFSASRRELSAHRTGFTSWGNIDSIYTALFPAPVGGIPQFPASFPGRPLLYADHLAIRPFPASGGIIIGTFPNAYQYAEISIEYRTIPYQLSPTGQSIITRRIDVTGEFMTLPNRKLKWASGALNGDPVKNSELNAGKLIGMQTYVITLHRVPDPPPFDTIDGLIGLCNAAEFELNDPETVLFLGAGYSQSVAYQGDNSWQIDLHFQKRKINGDPSIGWNYYFNSDDDLGKWCRIALADGSKPIPTGNFNDLY